MVRRFAVILLPAFLALIGVGSFASPAAADSAIWGTRVAVTEGVSDFNNRTFAELFRDAKFQRVELPNKQVVTFELDPRSVGADAAVIDFVMKRDGRESERFSFFFRRSGAYTILYKLSSDRGDVTGADELLLAMRRFYLPTLEQQ